jgi:hypothetical protein
LSSDNFPNRTDPTPVDPAAFIAYINVHHVPKAPELWDFICFPVKWPCRAAVVGGKLDSIRASASNPLRRGFRTQYQDAGAALTQAWRDLTRWLCFDYLGMLAPKFPDIPTDRTLKGADPVCLEERFDQLVRQWKIMMEVEERFGIVVREQDLERVASRTPALMEKFEREGRIEEWKRPAEELNKNKEMERRTADKADVPSTVDPVAEAEVEMMDVEPSETDDKGNTVPFDPQLFQHYIERNPNIPKPAVLWDILCRPDKLKTRYNNAVGYLDMGPAVLPGGALDHFEAAIAKITERWENLTGLKFKEYAKTEVPTFPGWNDGRQRRRVREQVWLREMTEAWAVMVEVEMNANVDLEDVEEVEGAAPAGEGSDGGAALPHAQDPNDPVHGYGPTLQHDNDPTLFDRENEEWETARMRAGCRRSSASGPKRIRRRLRRTSKSA